MNVWGILRNFAYQFIQKKRTMNKKQAEQIQNIIGPERVVTFHMSGHQLSDKGLVGFSGMVRYETMTEAQLDKFISKLKIWKIFPFLRFFM